MRSLAQVVLVEDNKLREHRLHGLVYHMHRWQSTDILRAASIQRELSNQNSRRIRRRIGLSASCTQVEDSSKTVYYNVYTVKETKIGVQLLEYAKLEVTQFLPICTTAAGVHLFQESASLPDGLFEQLRRIGMSFNLLVPGNSSSPSHNFLMLARLSRIISSFFGDLSCFTVAP